jgi:predicted metal-dependent phosphotriesterase family hydrolase
VATVETVRGPVQVAGLGPTLMHEHVFVLSTAGHDEVRAATAPSDDVLPALRDAGVTEAQIDQMLVDNPRRYFSQSAS